MKNKFFHRFKTDVGDIELPERFNFPFYYKPHRLCKIAAAEVQEVLEVNACQHNYGIDPTMTGYSNGKMFGVLVVRNSDGEIGYLAAFSGKLADANHHEGFVPPIFDMLDPESYFKQEERELNKLTRQIEVLENESSYVEAKQLLAVEREMADSQINTQKAHNKEAKKLRKARREEAKEALSKDEYDILCTQLDTASMSLQSYLKYLQNHWKIRLSVRQQKVDRLERPIFTIKEARRNRSNAVQKYLHKQYSFLNARGEQKDLLDIFGEDIPPAGSGECAAPKLFQYAYTWGYEPISLAEFWWGEPSKSAVKKHKQYYPSCRSKCEPILGHMLQGLEVDPNPMLDNPGADKEITILYEDDCIIVINKPHELLSVPGRRIKDSVQTRIKEMYPEINAPVIVHRLDLSTSGLMVLSKSKYVHEKLQRQFSKRYVKKRYIAVLDGEIRDDSGVIELPLRVDLDNRPRQLVCYEHGKQAKTKWEVIERKEGRTRVYFYPVTGRTHQLRVHAAHAEGLDVAIVGDDLYGILDTRLHLHAERIEFTHPQTKEVVSFQLDPGF